MEKRPGHQALRIGRVSVPHQFYLITTTTADRRPWFADANLARGVASVMIDDRTWGDARLNAWVLMPDHWHGLVQLGDRDGLALVVNRFKALSAKALSRDRGAARIWARGYHDHALRRDESILRAGRYIVANPIRAGIVSDPLDYPYWDAVWL